MVTEKYLHAHVSFSYISEYKQLLSQLTNHYLKSNVVGNKELLFLAGSGSCFRLRQLTEGLAKQLAPAAIVTSSHNHSHVRLNLFFQPTFIVLHKP